MKILFLAFFFGLSGCKGKGSGKDGSTSENGAGNVNIDEDPDKKDADPNGSQITDGPSLSISVVNAGVVALSTDGAGLNLIQSGGTPLFRQSTTAEIESISYAISKISICNNQQGLYSGTDCLVIYQGNGLSSSSDIYGKYNEEYDAAKAATQNFINLMDAEQLKKLSNQIALSAADAREYNYGIIQWARPIKLKAAVAISDTLSVYTKDARPKEIKDSNNWTYYQTNVNNLTTGPAEEGIIIQNNGEAQLKFSRPFVISTADIDAKTGFQLDITFNPEGLISVRDGMGEGINGGIGAFPATGTPDPVYSLTIPMLGLTPIAHKSEDSLYIETYLFTFNGDNPSEQATENKATEFKVRVQLYYAESDPNNILGVENKLLFTENTKSVGGILVQTPQQVTIDGTGNVSINSTVKGALFTGFKRLPTNGDTGSAKMNVGHQAEHVIDVSYQRVSVVKLSD